MLRPIRSTLALCSLCAAATFAADALARRPAETGAGEPTPRTATEERPTADAPRQRQAGLEAGLLCRTTTLSGTYLFREEGIWAGNPYRSSGLETFDARGGIVGLATDSGTGQSYDFSGTYELGGDCHGRVRYDGDYFYDIYVSPDGASIEFIATDVGAVLSGPSQRVTHQFLLR